MKVIKKASFNEVEGRDIAAIRNKIEKDASNFKYRVRLELFECRHIRQGILRRQQSVVIILIHHEISY